MESRIVTSPEQLRENLSQLIQLDYTAVNDVLQREVTRCKEELKKAIAPLDEKRPLSSYDIIMNQLASGELESSKRCPEYTIRSEDVAWLKEKKLIVWGYGVYGKRALQVLNDLDIPVHMIVDSDSTKNTTVISNIEYSIYRPNKILEVPPGDAHILISVNAKSSIISQLEEWGVDKDDHRWIKDVIKMIY